MKEEQYMSENVSKEGISDLNPEEIAEKLGIKKFQGKQVFGPQTD